MRNKRALFAVLVVCMALVAGCVDEHSNSRSGTGSDADYRDAWVGTYVGDTRSHLEVNYCEVSIDTVYVSDSLLVAKRKDNGLMVAYRGRLISVECNSSGRLSFDAYPHGGGEGQMAGDSLHLTTYEHYAGRSLTNRFDGRMVR